MAKMRWPSVLMVSGSSTPTSWLLVVENDDPLDVALLGVAAIGAAVTVPLAMTFVVPGSPFGPTTFTPSVRA